MEGYSSSSSYDCEMSDKEDMGDTDKAMESLSSLEKEEKYKILNFFAEFSELGTERAENKKDSVNNSLSIIQLNTTQNVGVNKKQRNAKRKQMMPSTKNRIDIKNIGPNFPYRKNKNMPFEEPIHTFVVANEKPNFWVVVGEELLECHLELLRCYSGMFNSVEATTKKHLILKGITMMTFCQVYEWMLSTKTIPICDDTIMAMLNAAQLLGNDDLKEQCWRCLDNDLIVREKKAFNIYLQSKLYTQMDFLQELLLGRVSKFFLTLVASRDFLELDVNEVCALLSSHSISVNMEAEVMMSAIHWMKHNEEERVQHTEKLMECIRFTLMPTTYLVKLKDGKICVETTQLLRFPAVKRNIITCLKYLNRMGYSGIAPEHSFDFMLENRSMIVRERQWIMDAECGYHHHLQCKTRTCLIYAQFEKYIKVVSNLEAYAWKQNHFVNLTKDPKTEKCLNVNCLNTSLIPYRNPKLYQFFGLHVLGQTYKSLKSFQSKMDEIEDYKKR